MPHDGIGNRRRKHARLWQIGEPDAAHLLDAVGGHALTRQEGYSSPLHGIHVFARHTCRHGHAGAGRFDMRIGHGHCLQCRPAQKGKSGNREQQSVQKTQHHTGMITDSTRFFNRQEVMAFGAIS
jgi:hypothetical protein